MDIPAPLARAIIEAQGIALEARQAESVSAALHSLAPAQRLTRALPFEAETADFGMALLGGAGR
ncbi:hypothetical protein [Arenibaculum pallidiluteum]|uniref:hypothetical protein n=1 Tax=Arenibaculum pallidiluteum TaxID=2812559 RepID=UPI001A96A659|nr:hypothetical protein [Arenibaculum pallidiluteum]